MAYGREQLIYSLTPAGEALGLTVADLGQQLRTAFDGQLVQIFQDGPDEVEVRVRLPEAERNRLSSLYRLNVRTPDGRLGAADRRGRVAFSPRASRCCATPTASWRWRSPPMSIPPPTTPT